MELECETLKLTYACSLSVGYSSYYYMHVFKLVGFVEIKKLMHIRELFHSYTVKRKIEIFLRVKISSSFFFFI